MAVDLFKIGLYLNALEAVFAIQWWAVAVPQLSFAQATPVLMGTLSITLPNPDSSF